MLDISSKTARTGTVGGADPARAAGKVIAILLPNLGGGGAERVALTLAEAFVERGHQVDLVVMESRGELVDLLPPTVRLVDLKARRIRNVLRPLIRYLRERRPDALQVSMWPLTIMGIIAARVSRIPVRCIVSDHSALSHQYRRILHPFIRATVRTVYPFADRRVVVSDGVGQDLAELSGLPKSSFDVIYNPVDKPPADLRSTPTIERLWGEADGRIVTVGTLKQQKNHALLIRSFAHVRASRAARLMIVGAGPLETELRNLANSLGLEEDVVFAGFDPDRWPYYASADLFVLSSDYEGFALVIVEAMRCGLPIVSTDCRSGPDEVLQSGRFGTLVAMGDELGLARAMERALLRDHSPELLKGRAAAIADYEPVQRYIDVLLADSTSIV